MWYGGSHKLIALACLRNVAIVGLTRDQSWPKTLSRTGPDTLCDQDHGSLQGAPLGFLE